MGAGFDFALDLARAAGFRDQLAAAGWYSGMTVIALEPGVSWEFGELLAEPVEYPVLLARQQIEGGWQLQVFSEMVPEEPMRDEGPRQSME